MILVKYHNINTLKCQFTLVKAYFSCKIQLYSYNIKTFSCKMLIYSQKSQFFLYNYNFTPIIWRLFLIKSNFILLIRLPIQNYYLILITMTILIDFNVSLRWFPPSKVALYSFAQFKMSRYYRAMVSFGSECMWR